MFTQRRFVMTTALLLFLFCLGPLSAVAGEKATNGPAILFVTHWGRANGGNEAYLKRLLETGFKVSSTTLVKVQPELLSQFDVVV